MFGFGVLLLASAAAQSVDPLFNYEPGLEHTFTMWGQAVATVPLTNGWEYLFDGNRANGTTWAEQQPGSEVSFRNREGRTVLQTSQPRQAFSVLFTGRQLLLVGQVAGAGFDSANREHWQVHIDGELAPRVSYDLWNTTSPQQTLFSSGTLQSNVFHNVTFITGPQFSGVLTVSKVQWSTQMMREGNANMTAPISGAKIGTRLSFAKGDAVHPLLRTNGDVAVQQYEFQNAEEEAALVLKGDASIETAVPANSSYIECDGYIGPDYGVVNFALDPPPPGSVGRSYMSRSTKRTWYTHDTMLSLALNPNLQYKLTVSTEAATAGAGVYLNGSHIFPFSNNAWVDSRYIFDTSTAPFWIKQNVTASEDDAPKAAPSDGVTGNDTLLPLGSSSESASLPVKLTSEKTNVGAIAGGAIGGVLVAALLATAIFFFLRRRRRNDDLGQKMDFAYGPVLVGTDASASDDQLNDLGAHVVSPYGGGHSAAPPLQSQTYPALSPTTPTSRSSPTESSSDYPSHRVPLNPEGSSSGGGTVMAKTKAMFTRPVPAPRPVSPEIVQERDGGAVPQISVPPIYDPAWAEGLWPRETQ